jgi:hypothetical protein
VQITNKKMIEEWIDDHGIDSDYVKIRVRGMFPAMSAKQFFSITDLDAAFGKHLRLEQYMWAPKILVLDNSWEGDDPGVISLRQGLKFDVLRKFPKNNNDVEIANMLARLEDEHKADAVFVDGGYGTGVISVGPHAQARLGDRVVRCAASADSGCLNKRAEMYRREQVAARGRRDPARSRHVQRSGLDPDRAAHGRPHSDRGEERSEEARPALAQHHRHARALVRLSRAVEGSALASLCRPRSPVYLMRATRA